MFHKRKKRAPLRICDYPDCLERATFDVEGGHACGLHREAVARIASHDIELRGDVA